MDTARAILDGHIVLSRDLAQLGIFPAIDLNQSLSRIMNSIISEEQQNQSEFVKKLYSVYLENKDLLLMGGYSQGQNAEIDSALNNWPKICDLIKQNYKTKSNFDDSIKNLMKIN